MRLVIFFITLLSWPALAASNLVVVTIDGLRWQEVFRGIDPAMLDSNEFTHNKADLEQRFPGTSNAQKRAALMPFFWQTLAKQGVVIGNRDIGSTMSVANPWYFSYPGYSEIFTGVADPALNSNQKVPNPNVSFVEYLNNKPAFGKKLAVFAGWDVFPAIFNVQRSKLYVNAGFMPARPPLTDETRLLNTLQQEIPSPWETVRLDAFTYRFAKDYLLQHQPRVLVIAFGETDDFAHDGEYDQYIKAAHRTDQFIADLWHTLQSLPQYKNNTNMLITTDHGRGSVPAQWPHHASKRSLGGYMQKLANDFPEGIEGSQHIWLAAIGPDVPGKGQVATKGERYQQQIAATALHLLGINPINFNPEAASALQEVLNP